MTYLGSLPKRFLRHGIRAFGRNQDGVSAVEFALIAPIMVGLYFLSVELSLLMRADRKVTNATATLGDLTARAQEVDDNNIREIFEATRLVFEPFDYADAVMTISSLVNNDGTIEVEWSDRYEFSEDDAGEQVTAIIAGRTVGSEVTGVPTAIVPTSGETVIFAEIEYNYVPAVSYFLSGTRTLSDEFFVRPRRSANVERQ